MWTQAETEDVLREMFVDFNTMTREQMARTGKPVTTMALATTQDSIAVLTVLDASQYLTMFREAVQTLGATGLVFVHDGSAYFQDADHEALIVVWASMWGNAEGVAHVYERTPFGIQFGQSWSAEADHLSPFLRLFHTPPAS